MCEYSLQDIPISIRERLAAEGREMIFYDPVKLANILLNLDGHSCRFSTTQRVRHLGGVSAGALFPSRNLYARFRRRCSALIPRSVFRIAAGAGVYKNGRGLLTSDEIRH